MTTDRAKRYADARQQVIDSIQALALPALGETGKRYSVELTEPEINSIHAAVAFVASACKQAGLTNYWAHYGPTLEMLSERLAVFDD